MEKAKVDDLIEFKWTWFNAKLIRKGIIKKLYPIITDIFGKDNEQYYDVDCSQFQPTHSAFVSHSSIMKINGKQIVEPKKNETTKKQTTGRFNQRS